MPPSLRFTCGLAGLAALCAAMSLGTLAWQDRQQAQASAEQLTGGSVPSGRQALRRHGCGGCHTIRGVDGASGQVGPSLNGIALRATIAGRLHNQPDNLVRWIRHPQQVSPGTGMPELPLSDAEARDMAAYLYTLQSD